MFKAKNKMTKLQFEYFQQPQLKTNKRRKTDTNGISKEGTNQGTELYEGNMKMEITEIIKCMQNLNTHSIPW